MLSMAFVTFDWIPKLSISVVCRIFYKRLEKDDVCHATHIDGLMVTSWHLGNRIQRLMENDFEQYILYRNKFPAFMLQNGRISHWDVHSLFRQDSLIYYYCQKRETNCKKGELHGDSNYEYHARVSLQQQWAICHNSTCAIRHCSCFITSIVMIKETRDAHNDHCILFLL